MLRPGIHSVKKDATNSELQTAIEKAVPMATKQMAVRSQQFKGATEKETCKKVFDYLKALKYKADGDEQQIRLPSGLVRTGTGDCKSYALFTSSVLSNLNIPHYLVYTSYNQDPTPTHVYVMTKNGCIVDAVWGKFNSEKTPTYKIKKDMNISYIAGTGYRRSHRMGAVSTITLSIPRQILLGLYSTNVDGLATVAAKNMAPLEAKWVKMGGSLSAIRAAVRDGNAKKPKPSGALTRLKSWIEDKAKSKGIKINGTMIGATVQSNEAIKKMLTDGGSISISYRALLDTLGAVIGGFVASVVPGVGTAAGAGAGATIGEVMYAQTGTIVDALFPVTATTSTPAPSATDAAASTGSDSATTSSINPLYIVAAAGAAYLLLKKK